MNNKWRKERKKWKVIYKIFIFARYSHLEKYSKISRNLNGFTLPKISNSIHIKYTHDSINLNNTINKSSWVQNEKYTLTVPFELANLKNPHHDQNESWSYEMPSSTPEFIESPLTSGNSQNINQRESFNIAPSGLSTFKRIAESSPNIGNESSLDWNNEESKYLNQQPTSKFQVWIQIIYTWLFSYVLKIF